MVFVKNRPFFHVCFVGKSSHKRSFFDILDRKECFLDRNINVWKKSKKSKICKGVSPWFLSKIDVFLMCVFFGKSSLKGYFFDILNRKECFLDRNWEVWKKCKKWNMHFLAETMGYIDIFYSRILLKTMLQTVSTETMKWKKDSF